MKLLKPENVQICDRAENWQEAIRISTKPLEKGGYVEQRYKEEIISNVNQFGPYIIIAEHVVMPHARPEQGTCGTQFAVTLFRTPVLFDNGLDGKLFITLAAADNKSHMEALAELAELLDDEERIARILDSENENVLYQYFK